MSGAARCATIARLVRTLATVAAAAGITDSEQAIAAGPHRGNPELDHLRLAGRDRGEQFVSA